MAFESRLSSVTGAANKFKDAKNSYTSAADKYTKFLNGDSDVEVAESEAIPEDATTVEGNIEPPYEQFEMCCHDDFECKYKDNNGRCIFETCRYDNITPPRTLLWYYTCLICKRPDTAKVEELRAPFCHSCIERMQKVEELPHSCRYCGKSINQPANWMFSGICDECDSIIKGMIAYYRGVRKWWKPL